ncbi:hypothetical protein FRC12_011912 [Ceratobasidium sp. 428]|nr:hypothetical protein FRC12_011912 [Ceratobasidium sp. 428]
MLYPTASSSISTTPNNHLQSDLIDSDGLSVQSYGCVTVVDTPPGDGSTYKTPILGHVTTTEETHLLFSTHLTPRTGSWRAGLEEAWVRIYFEEFQTKSLSAHPPDFTATCYSCHMPSSSTNLTEYSLAITSTVIVGRLSTEMLAGASLGIMMADITGFSIIQGFAYALDSLLPAAWTSANPSHVGLWTQRILVLMAFLLVDPQVASLAAVYLRFSVPQLPAYAFNAVIRRYFQAQGLLHVPSFITLIVAPINVGLNYALVWGPEPIGIGQVITPWHTLFHSLCIRFIGAPVATSISVMLMSVLYLVYAVFFTSHKAWHRISIQSLHSLPKLLGLALTGVGQSVAEGWYWESIGLEASLLGPMALATQSVLLMTSCTLYQVHYAFGIASSVRVGNLLGANNAVGAAVASKIAVWMSLFGGLIHALILMLANHKVSYLYTSDDQIAALVADLLPLVATYQIVDSLAAVAVGMLRACGKIGTGAVSNFIGYYFIGIPLGVYLTFWQGLGLKGLWIGAAAALVFVAAVLGTVVLRLDWDVQVRQAKERVEDKRLPSEEPAQV